MTRTIITCDECSTQKGEGNGWFIALLPEDDVLRFFHYSNQLPFTGAFTVAMKRDVCGRECSQKVLERWLDTGSILKPETGDVR